MALDFPSSPVNGQVYDNFIYDAAKGTWKSLSSGASPNYLVNPTITDAVITATATTPSTIPLTVNGAASQSANLQEWKNSAGVTLANIDQYGAFKTSYTESSIPHLFTANNSSLNTAYNYVLRADNDTGAKVIHFLNSSARTVDGGANAYTIRNDGGPLVLGSTSYDTTIYNRVIIPNQPSFLARGATGITGSSTLRVIVFNKEVNFNVGSGYNSSNGRFTAPVSGKYFFEFHIFATASFRQYSVIAVNGNAWQEYTQEQPTGGAGQGYASLDGKIVLSLAQGDYVDVRSTSSILSNSSIMCSFSGFLIG